MSRKKHDLINSEVFKRYKKSINLDAAIVFVPGFILIVILGSILETRENLRGIAIFTVIASLGLFFFTQDFLFQSSLGKRFYKIKIVTPITSKKLLLYNLVIRRLLESKHPILIRDIQAYYAHIDQFTQTKIVDDSKKKAI